MMLYLPPFEQCKTGSRGGLGGIKIGAGPKVIGYDEPLTSCRCSPKAG